MTVASETNRSGPYNGNGVTTAFDYEFRIVDASHVAVILADADGNETTLTLTTDYTVEGVGDNGGGQVIMNVAPATGEALTMIRAVPFVQETDLENQGAYNAEDVEDALDLAAMRDQQLAEGLSRALQIPVSADPSELEGLIGDVIRLADSADSIDVVATNVDAVNEVAGALPELVDNLTDITNFADVYQGGKATAPTTRNDGSPLQEGDLYFDTTIKNMMVFDGATWNATSQQALNIIADSFVATAGQDEFVLGGIPAVAPNLLVWVGGVRQRPFTDYTVSDNTLTLTTPASDGLQVDTVIIATTSTLNDPADSSVTAAKLSDDPAELLAIRAKISAMPDDPPSDDPPLNFLTMADALAYVPNVETRADLADTVQLAGYYANGDGGRAVYKKAVSEPAHGGKLSITVPGDGVQWYEIAEKEANVLAFGASHTLADNAPFIQAALEYAQSTLKGGAVFLPAPPVGQVYTLEDPLTITRRCKIYGEGRDVTLYAQGFSNSTAILNYDGDALPALEYIAIESLTLRSDTTPGAIASGVYFQNTAHILMRDVQLFDCYDGIYLQASGGSPRSFSNRFENVHVFPQAKRYGVNITSFDGGGHHKFDGCTFGGLTGGFAIQSNANIASLMFANCNFEQSANAFRAYGTVEGIGFYTCHAEKNTGGYTFGFLPTNGALQAGIVFSSGFLETDSEDYAILLGDNTTTGKVAGFNITGLRSRDYATSLVRYQGGNVFGGEIVANQIGTSPAVTSNGPAINVRVANNYNDAGAVS